MISILSKITISLLMLVVSAQAAGSDLSTMTQARVLFGKGDLDGAFKLYNKIPKSSDYWLEAVEEKAHVMGRKKNYAEAIGLLETSLSPAFIGVVGPEPYFVKALTHLKICDYSGILKTTDLFKERFIPRVAKLEQISKSGDSEAINVLLSRLEGRALTFENIGAIARDLPRMTYRNKDLVQLFKSKRSLERDAKIRAQLQAMAKSELNEIEKIVSKMQLIDGEVIQRVHLAKKSDKDRAQQGKFAKGSDVLTFPYDDEVWLDELDNYKAKVEKCPDAIKRVTL